MTKAIAKLQNISFSNPNKKILENTRKKEHLDISLLCFCKKNTDFLKQGQSLHCLRDQFTYDF